MPWYRAFVRGENFFLEVDGKVQRFGFYTNRFVEAADPREAENTAVARIRSHDRLRSGVCNLSEDPPMIYVDEIAEISRDDVPEKEQGLAFFVSEVNG